MPDDDLNALVERKKRGEDGLGKLILDRIARDVYERPRLYGLRSEDDVGEVFGRYWPRIVSLVERYEDVGSSFEAFLVSTLRYMALSVRRKQACSSDREAVFVDESKADIDRSMEGSVAAARSMEAWPAGAGPAVPAFPPASDSSASAVAFRHRILFLCIKCANMVSDDEARVIARGVGLDEALVIRSLHRARSAGFGQRRRTASRRRGRDAAWMRYETACRRLSRETDPAARRLLEESIERDRGLYRRAVALIARSKTAVPNKAVAELLGIPKGTVDCGVGRIMRQYAGLYTGDDSR